MDQIQKFKHISWDLKHKFVLLKQIIETDKSTDKLISEIPNFEENVVLGIIQGLSVNHLVPHCASLYQLLRKFHSEFRESIGKSLWSILEREDTPQIVQINFFKYFTPEDNLDVLIQILPNAPNFVKIKIIHILQQKSINPTIEVDNIVQLSLRNHDSHLRLATFSYLCDRSHQPLEQIQQFIIENAYIENSSFRNEFMKIYTNFLVKIQEVLYKHIKGVKSLDEENRMEIEDHYVWCVEFIKNCLKLNNSTSYQRNKLALQLYEFFLNNFEVDKDLEAKLRVKGVLKKSFLKQKSDVIKIYLESLSKYNLRDSELQQLLIQQISNENSDIRNDCSELIITYHKNSTLNFQELYQKSTANIFQNSMFYQIESNIKLLETSVKCDPELIKNIPEMINNYLKLSQMYSKDLFENFGERLLKGNELYSYLLIFLKFKSSLSEEQLREVYELCSKLIDIFLGIFHHGGGNEVPSFAEMSAALISLLKDDEGTMLNDDEQILLNRIWLNVKICCELVTAVGILCNDRKVESKCLSTLVMILQKNRHKGIIEAAGFSITSLVRHLTSNGKSEQVVWDNLELCLTQITNANLRSSCTRRTAGLAILIYKMCLGEYGKEKKILAHIIESLVSAIPSEQNNVKCPETKDAIIDNVAAVALHCLKPLVHDSCLWMKTQNYLQVLIKICFDNMSGNDWNIKNAALQLYGALIRKIIGQNNEHSIEDIHQKYPFLLPYLIELFQLPSRPHTFEILELLSQTYVISNENTEITTIVHTIKQLMKTEFSSHNYYLRNLAAKTYSKLTPLQYAETELQLMLNQAENYAETRVNINELHGYILVIAHLRLFLNRNNISFNSFNTLFTKIENLPPILKEKLIDRSFQNEVLEEIVDIDRCVMSEDEDDRLNLANYLLSLESYTSDLLLIGYKLLTDEIETVRETTAKIISKLQSSETEHPYCAIQTLFTKCLPKLFSEYNQSVFILECLCRSEKVDSDDATSNPFKHVSVQNNLEDIYLFELWYVTLKDLVGNLSKDEREKLKEYFRNLYLREDNSSKVRLSFIERIKILI